MVPGTATVADASLTGSPTTVLGAEGQLRGSAVVANFTDANPNAPVSDFSATIDWGDGTSSPATGITKSVTGFTVQGSHTYGSEGTYTVTVTVRDDGGSSVMVPSQAVVGGFVTQLYYDLLERAPDAAGLHAWVTMLHSGVPRQVVADAFWQSAEHRGKEVDTFYSQILHRPADPAGRAAGVNALLSGMSEANLAAAMFTSPEYEATHPGRTGLRPGCSWTSCTATPRQAR
jgi:hypothetical protein